MASAKGNGSLSAGEVAGLAMRTVEELTGFSAEAATSLEWDEDAWCVTVQALELERVPNTTDVLGAYRVRLDGEGKLQSYKRVRRFARAEAHDEE